ncbi:hypothetical protein BKA93DRAFT_160631 [Sparassis latifolia]
MTQTWKVFGLHVHFTTLSDSSTSKPASPYPDDQSSSSDELKLLTTESVVSHFHCTEDAQKQCRAPADPTTETLSPAPFQPLPLGTFVVPLPTVCGSGVSSAVLPSSSIPEGEQFSASPDMSAVSPIVVPVLSDPTFRWDISEHPYRVFEKAAFVYEAATEPAASSIIVRIKVESFIWDITVDGSPFVTVEEVLAAVYRCIRALLPLSTTSWPITSSCSIRRIHRVRNATPWREDAEGCGGSTSWTPGFLTDLHRLLMGHGW